MPLLLFIPLFVFLPFFALGLLSAGAADETSQDDTGGSILGGLLGSTAAVLVFQAAVWAAIVYGLHRVGFWSALRGAIGRAWDGILSVLKVGTLGLL